MFNSLCLNVMFVCSVGTLLFNGNPLLRYDGYYILVRPGRRAEPGAREATAAAAATVRASLPGHELAPRRPQADPRAAGWLVVYAVASAVYRWVVVIAILWGLRPRSRGRISSSRWWSLLAAITVIGMVWPASCGRSRRRSVARGGRSPRRGAAWRSAARGRGVLLCVLVPVPMRVRGAGGDRVSRRAAGLCHRAGHACRSACRHRAARSTKGEALAQLATRAIELEVAKLTSDRDRQQLYLANLESRSCKA